MSEPRSASYARHEDIEMLRRQLDAAQNTLVAHERHLAAHDKSLESGSRRFAMVDRCLRSNFYAICTLFVSFLAVVALLAVTR